MQSLIDNVKNIGHLSSTLCILKGLRSKIEMNRQQTNRLTKHFKNLKIIMLVGAAGVGKTYTMERIFKGLNLNNHSKNGITTGVWLDGASTTVGRRLKFKEHPTSVICWNEIMTNDINDVRLMKQVSEGLISYYKQGDLDETKFTGLLIACSNDIAAKGRVGKDLQALMDRMDIIHLGPPEGYDPDLCIENEKHYYKSNKPKSVDWQLIASALAVDNDEPLSEEERTRIRPHWIIKARECLDDRVLTRAGFDYADCFVFVKRFFGQLNEETFKLALLLAEESVTINPLSISNLTLLQRDIVDCIKVSKNKTAITMDIETWLKNTGRFTAKATMHRNLYSLVEKGFIVKARHGEYSMLRVEPLIEEPELTKFNELLRLL